MTDAPASSHDHPSAGRGEVGLWRLIYGLTAAPAAWITAQVACATLARIACLPEFGPGPRAEPPWAGLHLVQAGMLTAALVICASGAVLAYAAWMRTRGEHEGGQGALLEIGEGRSRFMAMAGLLTSLGFFVGGLFSIPAILFVSGC